MSRRGENIYKRKDGRWEGRYICGYDPKGKSKYRSVYAQSYKEVKVKLINAKSGAESETGISSGSISAKEWFEYWLNSIRGRIKESTYTVYKRYIDNHIAPYFADAPMCKISQLSVQRFIDSKNELSPATVNDLFVFFRSGIQAANKYGIVQKIWEDIILPKSKSAPMRVFSQEEQRIIENYVSSSSNLNYIGILICLYTGLRIGEVCALKWEDINFIRKTLYVRRTIQRISDYDNGGTKIIIAAPKSEHSLREIPMPYFLKEKLSECQKRCGRESGYVLNIYGNPIEPRTYQYQFQRLLKEAGIEKANFHALRHTFSARALELGFDIKTLSEILGHANAAITLKTYAHSLDEHKRQSMELFNKLYI